MNKKDKIKLLLLILLCFMCNAQKLDTIQITPECINTKVLKEGTHRYVLYFIKGKDASYINTILDKEYCTYPV